MIKFEKVSYEQFKKDCENLGYPCNKLIYDRIIIPKRSTKHSCGYDIATPFYIFKMLGEDVIVPTGIRVRLEPNTFMAIVPRSSLGFKSKSRLANTVGIIDADYYFADNEGDIFLKFTSGSFEAFEGQRVVQGIIMPYLTTDDDNTEEIRTGGIGSTDKKERI